jgi:mannose-6-phosphate isomerase-like protein (cupin superfamily)
VTETGLPGRQSTVRTLLGGSDDSEQLVQRLFRIPPGTDASVGHPGADDVFYVAEGTGRAWNGSTEEAFALTAGTAGMVPPLVPCTLTNLGAQDMWIVSVLSPPPFSGAFAIPMRVAPVPVLHEDDQEDLPAGEDRHFRLLIEPKHGARNVTQFVGFIDRSRAPFHTHAYEEAIYILEGVGIVHVEGPDGFDGPIREGSSIFLPPGIPHCLENTGDHVLKLLGVFSPPGSPASKGDAG